MDTTPSLVSVDGAELDPDQWIATASASVLAQSVVLR
jgi:hypothetical protein